MMDTGHNYLSVVYSTTIYPYNADGRDLYKLLECDYSFMKETEKWGSDISDKGRCHYIASVVILYQQPVQMVCQHTGEGKR